MLFSSMSSFMSRSYSSGEEESYNAAELEAHLYSQIYHDNQQNFEDEQSSSIVLYQCASSNQTQTVSCIFFLTGSLCGLHKLPVTYLRA